MVSVDDLRQQLIESQLMTAVAADEQISRWREQTGVRADSSSDELLDWLVQQSVLTEFQGDALKAGHTGPFMLGPYRVFERVAVGRLGNVYRAMHDELNQPVSLKVFPSSLTDDSEKITRMEREFRATLELDHPNIVRSFEIGKVGDVHYLALQDLHGETLADRLNREGALAYPIACKLILDAARALTHLHGEGLIHRDVNPANIWIADTGNCLLMEMGAVRDALGGFVRLPDEDQITTAETDIGTLEYMAPEQASDAHAADQRSDIYSLGCTLYHCLAGEKPFKEKNPIKLVMHHASKMPTPLSEIVPDIPGKLSETVNSMMAKSPSDRYQKAQEVIWAVEPFSEQPSEAEQVASPQFLAWIRPGRKRSEEAILARSPELARFLDWLVEPKSANR